MEAKWPKVFTDDSFSYDGSEDSKKAACADGLVGWATCGMGNKPLQPGFGKGMVKIVKLLGIAATEENLMKYADSFLKPDAMAPEVPELDAYTERLNRAALALLSSCKELITLVVDGTPDSDTEDQMKHRLEVMERVLQTIVDIELDDADDKILLGLRHVKKSLAEAPK